MIAATAPSERTAVVVPCFNHAKFLPTALESVLEQDPPPVKLIVVDDGSSDDSAAVASGFAGVTVVRQANQGKAAAYNTGLRHAADADYLVFLDADDWLLPGALRHGLNAFADNPGCALALGLASFVDEGGRPQDPVRQEQVSRDHYRRFLQGNFVANPGAAMFRRSVFEKVGPFDTRLRNCEEYEMYLRVSHYAPACCHPHAVVAYRRHESNKSRNAQRMLVTNLLILRRERSRIGLDPSLRLAQRRGRQYIRSLYGNQVVNEVDRRLTEREWRAGGTGVVTLLRYYPTGIVRRMARKASAR